MPVPGSAQGSGEWNRRAGTAEVHRLPLLYDHLPVSHSTIPVEGFNPRVTKCELCKDASGKRIEAGMHHGLSDGSGNLRPALSAPDRGKTADRKESRTVLPESRLRRDRKRRHAGTVLSRVPFEKLVFRKLDRNPFRHRTLRWQRRFYQYFAFPPVLYAGLVQVIRKNSERP